MTRLRPTRAWVVVALAACGAAGAGSLPVQALPEYAARTGMVCRSCHFDPNGGGPRNDTGFLYARQRHDLTPDPDPRWTGVAASNRLGDALYFGTNVRGLYLYSTRDGSNGTDISTFFQMQGALHVTFRPHQSVAIVMDRDFGEFSGDKTRDLFGLIQDPGARFYFKVGRLRQLFGLRQVDHTAGTRAGFLRPGSGGTGGLLPFDPRDVETGAEGGIMVGRHSLSAGLTNGGAAFANKAQTVSSKITLAYPWGQVAGSIYDSFRSSSGQRFTRWGGYALVRVPWLPDLVVMGEAALGTDDAGGGDKRNLAATYVEASYRVSRALLLRTRYDFADVSRSVPGSASERFSVESDATVVPFADLGLAYRRIVPETTANEDEVLLMGHFYY